MDRLAGRLTQLMALTPTKDSWRKTIANKAILQVEKDNFRLDKADFCNHPGGAPKWVNIRVETLT